MNSTFKFLFQYDTPKKKKNTQISLLITVTANVLFIRTVFKYMKMRYVLFKNIWFN